MLARENFEGPQVWHNREQFCRIAERDWLDGGGFEVRNSRFSDLQTLNFELLSTPFSHVSLFTHHGCGTDEPFQHPAMTTLAGPSGRSSLTAEPFMEYKKQVP